jgi:hypothetical protein
MRLRGFLFPSKGPHFFFYFTRLCIFNPASKKLENLIFCKRLDLAIVNFNSP